MEILQSCIKPAILCCIYFVNRHSMSCKYRTNDFVMFCFVVIMLTGPSVFMWFIYPYPSGLLHWHWTNLNGREVTMKNMGKTGQQKNTRNVNSSQDAFFYQHQTMFCWLLQICQLRTRVSSAVNCLAMMYQLTNNCQSSVSLTVGSREHCGILMTAYLTIGLAAYSG